MLFDHSDGDGPGAYERLVAGEDAAYAAHMAELAPPVDCLECDGEGEVEHGIRRDYFGVWDTKTFRCTACDGTGRSDTTRETA